VVVVRNDLCGAGEFGAYALEEIVRMQRRMMLRRWAAGIGSGFLLASGVADVAFADSLNTAASSSPTFAAGAGETGYFKFEFAAHADGDSSYPFAATGHARVEWKFAGGVTFSGKVICSAIGDTEVPGAPLGNVGVILDEPITGLADSPIRAITFSVTQDVSSQFTGVHEPGMGSVWLVREVDPITNLCGDYYDPQVGVLDSGNVVVKQRK
jgi:hypothetical protein